MIKECCRTAGNLYRAWWIKPFRRDITVFKCRVCRCRHFRVRVMPGLFQSKGMELK